MDGKKGVAKKGASKKALGKSETDGGDALWRAVKESAHPIRRDTIRPGGALDTPAKPEKVESSSKTKSRRTIATLTPANLPDPKPSRKSLELAHGCAPGVDRRTADRLKKGRMEIEGRLDLHGMSREAAHRAVIGFVGNARATGKRCVLIVTGKGKGILQTELPRWLNLAPVRDQILSFSHARPQDGGSGAVYVLLKRERNAR